MEAVEKRVQDLSLEIAHKNIHFFCDFFSSFYVVCSV